MANRPNHRRFGSVRKRDSGRWQARYRGPDGRLRSAPQTFRTKREAEQWLSLVEAQLVRGEWNDPAKGDVRLGDYAEKWIMERAGLRPRTLALYRWLLTKHIKPGLGRVPLGKLTTGLIREWRATLLAGGVSQTMTAKSYRLLRAVFSTAVEEDGLLTRNPCRVREPTARTRPNDRSSPSPRCSTSRVGCASLVSVPWSC